MIWESIITIRLPLPTGYTLTAVTYFPKNVFRLPSPQESSSTCEAAPAVKIVTLQRHNVGLSKKIVIIENKIKLHLCCKMPDLRAIELLANTLSAELKISFLHAVAFPSSCSN